MLIVTSNLYGSLLMKSMEYLNPCDRGTISLSRRRRKLYHCWSTKSNFPRLQKDFRMLSSTLLHLEPFTGTLLNLPVHGLKFTLHWVSGYPIHSSTPPQSHPGWMVRTYALTHSLALCSGGPGLPDSPLFGALHHTPPHLCENREGKYKIFMKQTVSHPLLFKFCCTIYCAALMKLLG